MMATLCTLAALASALICDPAQQAAYESQAAIELAMPLIKRVEGKRLTAYRDPHPTLRILTIGYGHTGRDVTPGQRISEAQANDLLRLDCAAAAHAVAQAVRVPLTPNQRAAMISFAFNIGGPKFAESAVVRALNRLDYEGAARALLRYCYAGTKRLNGLAARRQAEKRLFESEAR